MACLASITSDGFVAPATMLRKLSGLRFPNFPVVASIPQFSPMVVISFTFSFFDVFPASNSTCIPAASAGSIKFLAIAPPFTEAEFDITYGEGISKTGDLIDVAVNAGIVDKSGSWYSHDGERIGQGRENVKRFLAENQDIYDSIYQKAREALGFLKKEKKEEAAIDAAEVEAAK